MKAIQFALTSLLVVLFSATASLAQVQRTFVSGLGSDANPCTRTAPCRTFGQAISQTNAGGEVVVLDSAGYGPFSITQPVSIIAPPGVYAGVSVFSGDGISINAGASDTIILRGLTVNNQGSSGNGIVFNTGGTLHVEGGVVNGFSSGNGILFAGAGRLEVKDSILRGNSTGIAVMPSTGTAAATIDQVRLEGSGNVALVAQQGSKVSVRDSVASRGSTGFAAFSNSSAPAELNIENCVASNNTNDGIQVGASPTGIATVRVSNSTVTDNFAGLDNLGSPAVLLSRGNNTVEGNSIDLFGTIGSYTSK